MKETEQRFWKLVDEQYKPNFDKETLKIQGDEINHLFKALIYQPGKTTSYFWKHCSVQTYRAHYKERLEKYTLNHIDHDEIDFLKSEYLTISKFLQKHDTFITILSLELIQLDAKSHFEKQQFLKEKLKDFKIEPIKVDSIDNDNKGQKNVITSIKWLKTGMPMPEKETLNKEIFKPTAYQKVLILDKMGLFEKLPRNSEGFLNNSTAGKILALITGQNHDNFRKHLNTLDKKDSQLSPKQQEDKLEIQKRLKELGWH